MSSEVIQFPSDKIVREVPPEVVKHIQEKGKARHAEAILDEVASIAHGSLQEYGIDTEPDSFVKDFAFVMEALRSLIYREFNMEHRLQDWVDKNVKIHESSPPVVEAAKDDDLPCDVEAK